MAGWKDKDRKKGW